VGRHARAPDQTAERLDDESLALRFADSNADHEE
jgi:hypothetical protein